MAKTNEYAFESTLEEMLHQAGWVHGEVKLWDKEIALFPTLITQFIKQTQTQLWATMHTQHGASLEKLIIQTLIKELASKGALHVLRHGFKFFGKTFFIAYFKPAHGLNPEVLANYQAITLTLTRQVPCHPQDTSTMDMVFAINGLPVATCELKNPSTGQTWRNAVRQYREDRQPSAPLFAFNQRALVHFSADTEEVYMSTRINGANTFFLPFNRGSAPGSVQCGAGNPTHPSGYRTGYFWQEVLARDNFLDIVGHYVFLDKKEEKIAEDKNGKGGSKLVTKVTMVFPRYHQWDATRNLIETARAEGAGQNYLIQHSAGSGKTNSISWLSHRLASLHSDTDQKIFDCVIVITDRQVLDRQLQDAIYQIEHAQGVVKAIDQDAKQLASALIDGTKIVITTLQKFPFVLRGLLHHAGAESVHNPDSAALIQADEWKEAISKRRYAVIVDEAHSSQSGESARELKALLGVSANANTKPDHEDESDWEDGINQVMASRGRQSNLSFFAFTATPKGKTLEIFGRKDASDKPVPFHLYSMRQAIEEGFILDVLQHYTTYKAFFKLIKDIPNDPALPEKKALRVLRKFTALHPTNISQKIEVIIEHFRNNVRHHLSGRAKAMVVTSTRLEAVKYFEAFNRYIADNGYTDIKPLVAFSGTVTDPDTGFEYTEPSMNLDVVSGKSIGEKQLPDRFASSDYQILLVANKYQTGFDQPLLMAMYVDKRLDGVQAVQTLSRLNRMFPGKEPPFVLDFVNEADDIFRAFKPYFDATTLQENSDPAAIENLKHQLNAFQVYHWDEVESFAKVFYRKAQHQKNSDHAEMQKYLQPAKDRFNNLEDDEEKIKFRDLLSGYVKLYAFIAQIIPYVDSELEMLYSFGRFLLPHLNISQSNSKVELGDEVALQYYRLQRMSVGAINLAEGEAEGVKSPTDVGTGRANEDRAPLSDIIDTLNNRFGTNFNEQDRLFFEQIVERAVNTPEVIGLKQANSLDKFQLVLGNTIEDFMIQRNQENGNITNRYLEDKAFKKTTFGGLSKEIYQRIPPADQARAQA